MPADLTGCDLPRDGESTTDSVRGRVLRVGVVQDDPEAREVLSRLATGLEARVEEVRAPTHALLAGLETFDWLTGLAAFLGVFGIGFGVWWLDSAMALVIATDIIVDGLHYLKNACADLMDRAPTPLDDYETPHPIIDELREYAQHQLGLEVLALRLRFHGIVWTGMMAYRVLGEVRRDSGELHERLVERFPRLHELTLVEAVSLEELEA